MDAQFATSVATNGSETQAVTSICQFLLGEEPAQELAEFEWADCPVS